MATQLAIEDAVLLKDVRVWTPSGEEVWSGYVRRTKAQKDGNVIVSYSQPEEIGYAKKLGGFEPSSGLWYQSRARLETESPDAEKDMITGVLEGTATLWKYLKIDKNFADGLLIQYPFVRTDEKDFERDEKGIPRARQIWQMALPVDSHYVHEMPAELATFANTLYGMEDAIRLLPKNAFVSAYPKAIRPDAEIRALRSGWHWSGRDDGRVYVDGHLAPSSGNSLVGFRVFEGGEDAIKDIDARRKKSGWATCR